MLNAWVLESTTACSPYGTDQCLVQCNPTTADRRLEWKSCAGWLQPAECLNSNTTAFPLTAAPHDWQWYYHLHSPRGSACNASSRPPWLMGHLPTLRILDNVSGPRVGLTREM
jgi:hypothetical protein